MHVNTQARRLDFLLDGDAFFARLHEHILRSEHESRELLDGNQAAARRSIRLAYWKADPALVLPRVTIQHGDRQISAPERRLIDALQAARYEGVHVQVLLWNAWKVECWTPCSQFSKQVRSLASQRPTAREGTFEVKKHDYRGYLLHPASSLHLKIAVFERATGPAVLLGGLNLGEDYKSSPQHDAEEDWHDAAIEIHGQAARVIETFTTGLWADQLPAQHSNAAEIPAQRERYATEVLTTDMRWPTAERDIRTRVVEQIHAAARFVYLENQALTDPAIIDALTAAAARGVAIICVVPHPKQTMLGDYSGYAYVMRFAYAAIALARMKSFRYPGKVYGEWTIRAAELDTGELAYQGWLTSGRTLDLRNRHYRGVDGGVLLHQAQTNRQAIDRTEAALRQGSDSLYENLTHPLLPFRPASQFMNRMFRWTGTGTSGSGSVYLTKITAIDSSIVPFYAPMVPDTTSRYPYVHSKIVIVDDEVAFIGTSNWTYRSMQFDAEMSLKIADATKVSEIRRTLFAHWGMGSINDGFADNPFSWQNKADSQRDNLERRRGNLDRSLAHIVPLTLDDLAVSIRSAAAWGSYAMGNQI